MSSFPVQQTYPQNRRDEITLALSEAFAWLEAQGLIVPIGSGYGRTLSRRAKRFESEREFANYAVARLLPKDMLHPKISEEVWLAFMRGDYDDAAFKAMRAVEISVRDATEIKDKIGVKLMRESFRDNGPLADMSVDDAAERQARMELFAGAIGSYKNPYSHREVDLNDPAEAVEIILLANHLLRIVDARKRSCTI